MSGRRPFCGTLLVANCVVCAAGDMCREVGAGDVDVGGSTVRRPAATLAESGLLGRTPEGQGTLETFIGRADARPFSWLVSAGHHAGVCNIKRLRSSEVVGQ
jgi:hypothetical protein